jgi:hypothetical protein
VPPEVVEQWTARLAADTQHRTATQVQARLADETWRESIKLASQAGLTAPQIAEVVGVSTFRVYQIRDGRRT